jgi:Nif-specific regulatory protein
MLTEDTNQRKMLADVLAVLNDLLKLERPTIMLLSPDEKEILLEVAHDLGGGELNDERIKIGEGITGRVIQTCQPAIVPKISEEPLFLNRLFNRRLRDDGELSFICVPIMVGRKVVGALSADRPFDPTRDLELDQRLLATVAGMIAEDVRARRMVAEETHSLEMENRRLRSELFSSFRPENLIGNSSAMRPIYRQIEQVSRSETTALILGESGTGKELVATAIHYHSDRAKGPFIRVNCAALSESLLESELFGHEKGAFTGALQSRKGRIESAEGGTLFLDEIGDFSPTVQVKLLRILQEREFERVGSNTTRKADVRIICATNRDLEALAREEKFRQDLFYRINVFPICLPPLRERRNDILQLADHFVERYSKALKKDVRRISTPAINMMVSYHWPGNVRELENCIERAVLLSDHGVIHAHHLPPTLQTSETTDTFGNGTLEQRVDQFESDIISDALKRTSGNVASAARDLGITLRIIRYKMKKLNIDNSKFATQGSTEEN